MKSFLKTYVQILIVSIGWLFIAFLSTAIPLFVFNKYGFSSAMMSCVGVIVLIICPFVAFFTKEKSK